MIIMLTVMSFSEMAYGNMLTVSSVSLELSCVCLIGHADVLRQTRLKGGFGSGGGMLRRCYHTDKQVSVCSSPTLINVQDIAGPIRLLTIGHVT